MSLNGGAQRVVANITKDYDNAYSVYVLRKHKNSHDLNHETIFTLSFIRSVIFSDYIVLNLFPTIYLFSWIGLFKNVIILEHNTTNRRRRYKSLRKIEKIIYSFSNKIIGCSNAISESLSHWLNTPVFTLNNCFDDKIFTCDKSDLSLRLKRVHDWLHGDGYLQVIMVGSFTDQKNQLSILEAMKSLSNIKLTLIGDGKNREMLELQTKLFGLESRVEFVGIVDSPKLYMRSADLMLHVANWEGFGLVALESQGMDLPIICSNVDGLANLVAPESLLVSNDCTGILQAFNNISLNQLQHIVDFGRENRMKYTLASYVKNLREIFYNG